MGTFLLRREGEGDLQSLLATSPELIPDLLEPAAVVTELSLPDVGYADLLIVEASGRLTLVECKLSSNSEIRRSVVGQVLAYAAALSETDYPTLDGAFAQRTGRSLAEFFDPRQSGWNESDFREAVAENLERGAFRLVIAVDEITDELKLIVGYLNRHTDPDLSLLALELRRGQDQDVEILLPRTYGAESAREKRPSQPLADEAGVLEAIRTTNSDDIEAAERVVALYEWMRDYPGSRLSWGRSRHWPSVTAYIGEDRDLPVSVSFFNTGFAVNFDFLRAHRDPRSLARLAELVREVPGTTKHLKDLEESEFRKRPTLPPREVMASDEQLAAWKRALEAATMPAGDTTQ